MSYYTRQSLLLTPVQKYNEDQPRVPAGQPGGGQFAAGGGGADMTGAGRAGEGKSGGIVHRPISFGKGLYGIERVDESGLERGGPRGRGRTPDEFTSMEAARAAAEELNKRVDPDTLKPKPGYFGRNLEGQRNLIGPPGNRNKFGYGKGKTLGGLMLHKLNEPLKRLG